MANLIKHKRSTTTASPTLSNGELGWTESGNVLFIGSYDGTTSIPVAGKRNPGVLTANQAIVTNSTSMIDKIMYGNSTANVVVNSSSVALSVNSTTQFVFAPPSAADFASATKYLRADGTWVTVTASAAAGGANTNVQFNDSTAINGSNSFNFDKTSNTVTLQNEVITGNLTVNSDFISLGNSTVNSVINSLSFVTSNGSVSATLNSTALMMGISSIGGASSTNGYSYFPNGLIFQWGYAAAGAAGVNAVFTIPFPTACFSVVAIPTVSTSNVWINALSTAQTYIRTTVACNVYYMAIGK